MREAPNILEPFQDMPAIRAWRREPLLAGLHLISSERPGGENRTRVHTGLVRSNGCSVFRNEYTQSVWTWS
jgi:hypothetical protein